MSTRLYITCESVLRSRRYLALVGRVAYMTAWLGTLDRRAMHEIAEWYYGRPRGKDDVEANYLDEEYNESGLFGWEQAAIDAYFADCRSVLVACAGAGREMIALAKRGIDVAGFEINPSLVSKGNALLEELSIPARIESAPPDTVPSHLGCYDGAIVGWAGYMHIFGRATRIEFLRALRPHVRQGGPVLLSFFFRTYDNKHHRLTAVLAGALRRVLRREGRIEVGDEIAGYYRHRFNRKDVEEELSAAGFTLEMYSEDGYGHAIARASSRT